MSDEKKERQTISIAVRFILIASLLLFLLATASEVYRSPDSPATEPSSTDKSAKDTLIVPGVRIGAMTLGLSTGQLNELLGQGKLRPHEAGVMHLYEDLGIVIYAEKEKIMSITVRTPLFRTRGDVGVGSDVSDVLEHLHQDSERSGTEAEYTLHNWHRGWHAGIKNDKVVFFQVTVPIETESPNS